MGKSRKKGQKTSGEKDFVDETPLTPTNEEIEQQGEKQKPQQPQQQQQSKFSLAVKILWYIIDGLLVAAILGVSLYEAYRIRLYPIKKYGRLIHEFDPWFHFRATQYLADNGLHKFFHWFDHRSWYPIGRPIGTTIYPGMQMTAVAIWNVLKLDFWRDLLGFSVKMTLNDVCVYIPAWFGSLATLALALLTREVSGSWNAAAAAAACMAVVPAHLMRSIAGEFDNECIAMFAMCLTFYLWCRSLRTERSWWIGALAGVAYAYMAASWGGFVHVCNIVALHAGFLMFFGHRTPSLHKAFSLYFIVGTALSMLIPIVGFSPLRSLEQISALYVFLGLNAFWLCDILDKKHKLRPLKSFAVRAAAVFAGVVVLVVGVQTGVFSPLSIRVRSLFIKHTKTGNPLVDSVAEHQPASSDAYWTFLLDLYPLMFVGFALVALIGIPDILMGKKKPFQQHFGPAVNKYFIILYGLVTYTLSRKMSRLILLMAPVATSLSGVAFGFFFEWAVSAIPALFAKRGEEEEKQPVPATKRAGKEKRKPQKDILTIVGEKIAAVAKAVARVHKNPIVVITRMVIVAWIAQFLYKRGGAFWARCDKHAQAYSNPRIMFPASVGGKEIIVRDYYDSYVWLRRKTPENSRVLAWWDYGYHITGIGNRTSLADGNTWNLEHIATVGRMLASPEAKAYNLTRMMADYVLVWAGNRGDDLSKSPHIARISSSVYDGICDNDPMCYSFGFNRDGSPTKTMAASMLYKMHSNGLKPGVKVNPKWFKEVYRSEHGLVRIYEVLNVDQKAKRWAMNPKNWKCDRPGSWYCPGQYPPGFPKPPSTHKDIDYKKLNVDFSKEGRRRRR